MAHPSVLNCAEVSDPSWRWLDGKLPADLPITFRHVSTVPQNALERRISRPQVSRYRAAIEAARLVNGGEIDLLVTHLPRLAAWTELFRGTHPRRVPHLVFSMNFTRLPGRAMGALMRRTFPRVERFVVYSSMERELYARTFGIPAERIDVLRWGVRPPPAPEGEKPLFEGDYICAIGGEGRDYGVLMEAMRRLPQVPAVMVARPHNLAGLSVPKNVTVKTNIPVTEAANILRYSRFTVVPLLHSQVPCGIVSLVNAMYLSRAVVATYSEGLVDYLRDGENGVFVPPGDAGALADRIQGLWRNPEETSRLGAEGLSFVQAHCSEQVTIDYFVHFLRSLPLAQSRREGWLSPAL